MFPPLLGAVRGAGLPVFHVVGGGAFYKELSGFLRAKALAGEEKRAEKAVQDETSRRHAEFRRTGDGFTVADVGSLNGTYVNRDRIDEVALQGGDEVQIGKYRLVYFASHSSAGR